MIRQCARHRITDDELRDRLGLECISVVMRRGRLRWFDNVERMDNGKWVLGVRSTNVGGVANRGSQRNTQNDVITKHLRDMGLNRKAARDQEAWRDATL